jgi:hypothetical protein
LKSAHRRAPPPDIPMPLQQPAAGGRAGSSPGLLRYKQQVAGVVERFQALRDLLLTIDRGSGDVRTDALEAAQNELQDLERTLAGLKPTETVRAAHDLLVRACGLARMAVRLRLQSASGEAATSSSNASSAAAGAILLLDRAVVGFGGDGAHR